MIGPYRIVALIGCGAFANVHLAVDPTRGEHVALKIAKGYVRKNRKSTAVQALESEIRALCRFNHSRIVHIYDDGVEDGRPFYVMEYLSGGDLVAKMDKRPDGQLSVQETALALLPILDALAYVHDAGYAHGDLNLTSVIFDAEGMPKLCDFSCVRKVTKEAVWSDLRSFGELFYYCLTCKAPFARGEETLPPHQVVPTIPAALGEVIMGLFQTPRPRYRNAAEAKEALEMAYEQTT